jgi:ribonuclease P protein component
LRLAHIIGRTLEQSKDRHTFPQHRPAQGRAEVLFEWRAYLIVIFYLGSERLNYAKTDVSTKADPAKTRTRLYGPYGHQSGATRTQGTTAKGAPPANGLGGTDMLPKEYRLTRSKDFARVRRFGRSSGSQLLVLYALPTNSTDRRIGFSVSKRVGKATIRNRVKRRLREAVRSHLAVVPAGYDLVFIARPPAAAATYAQLEETVGYLLRKSGTKREPARRAIHA